MLTITIPCTLAYLTVPFVTNAPWFPSTLAGILQLVPRLRKFNRDLNILNTVLTDLIARAKRSESKADLEDLQARNYDKVNRAEGGGERHHSHETGVIFAGCDGSPC